MSSYTRPVGLYFGIWRRQLLSFEMVDGLISGAVAGALVGEMLKKFLSLTERAIHFKRVLNDIRSQLEFLSSVIKQVKDEHGGFLDSSQDMKNVQQLIDKGKKLIAKCDAVDRSILKYPKLPFYTKKLRKLGAELGRTRIDLLLQLNLQKSKLSKSERTW